MNINVNVPSDVHESQQRVAQCFGQVHWVRSRDECLERDRAGPKEGVLESETQEKRRIAAEQPRRNGTFPSFTWSTRSCVTRRKEVRWRFWSHREDSESCVLHSGAEEVGGLREIGLEFGDIIVKSDIEAALTSLIASLRKLRAMKG